VSSTFAGLALFDSGPHRFAPRAVGRVWLPPFAIDELQATIFVGPQPVELAIEQTGRLVAPTDAQLWTQFDAIRTRAEAQLTGALVEQSGRSWPAMTLLRFRATGPVDRARAVSLPYEALYVRLAAP
jgi:hypothetical protein